MYEAYSWLALALSLSCFAVAVALTVLKSDKLIDQSFTVREWMFGLIFAMTVIVTQGNPDTTYDVFHGQVAQVRAVFMAIVAAASLVSAVSLLYTFLSRSRNTNPEED